MPQSGDLSNQSQSLIAKLDQPIQLDQYLNQIKILDLKIKNSNFQNKNFQNLNQNRAALSNTLLTDLKNINNNFEKTDLKQWIKVNEWVNNNLETDVTWGNIEILNSIINNCSTSDIARTSDTHLGDYKLPTHLDLPRLKIKFIEILNNEYDHCIFKSAYLYIWLINCHFFKNGNGRTSRLVVDWVLAKNNYPPISFENFYKTFICISNEAINVERSVQIILEGIENSLECLNLP